MESTTSKKIIIKIDNKNIHFSPTFSIPIQHSNLPIDHMVFSYYRDINWQIELVEYFKNSKCLHVKVLNYNAELNPSFNKQEAKKPIEKIVFDKLNWQELEPLLSSYKYIELENMLYNHVIKKVSEPKVLRVKPKKTITKVLTEIPEEIPMPPAAHIKHNPVVYNLNLNFSIKFQDAHFINGFVTFKKFLKKFDSQIDFKIQNPYILEEFDNIKMWFAKKLNIKRFDVSATITVIDYSISEIIAVSTQIELIIPEIIDSVKYDRTVALTKPPKANNPDKSLYTTEDIFKLIDPEVREGNIFGQSEIDIIKILSQTYQVRNFKQLEFLSIKKQDSKSIIHYTLNPLFGFVFLIEGNLKYHFIWELLQSHATYLWSIKKENNEIKSLYSKIEEIINEIRIIGRDNYKKAYDEKDPKFEFTFHPLEHQEISINLNDGFSKWRTKLEGFLK